ncbi:DUF2169 domain-containing protein [Oceanihabitans sp. 2_MG-2023]|uniref:DUF2169 domain-containing protein n=1 Tax=Oceanihabitans sp. 2_MG-2023 TaxID=3062661 RepID=UPI0026E2A97C|nr:DUF2169 domain-containing protein [Oceanihabitans sp. 2_MG-2023]MDO6597315.1 DUF2169 domain-containing protein [Oceanihabitans sp. 2_MG-2023]
MEFINNTSFHTLIHRTALDNDCIAMAIMCRITYDVLDDESLKISKDQEWGLHQTFWESEYGPMDTDDVYAKGGIDLMVFGSAKALNGLPVTESEVVVNINNKPIHKIKVYGKRTWKSFLGSLSISAPEPFTEIPLTLHNAFGGTAKWDGLEIPYPANPYGKGYYHKKEEAIGNVLPNIEHYNNRITKWNSWQEPAGITSFPIMSIKAKNNLVLNEEKSKIEKLKLKFFNSAFPELIIEEVNIMDTISIEGVTESNQFAFNIPSNNLEIDIILGDKKLKRKMNIDQIGVIPDKKKVFISYRFPFRYTINPMEIREFSLNTTA